MRRFFLFLALFVFCCVLFSAKIIGFGAKLALKRQFGWELSLDSSRWEGSQLVFSRVSIFDPSLHFHVDEVTLKFDWSLFPKKIKLHLSFEKPHLHLQEIIALPEKKEGWIDFSCSIKQGILYFEEEPIQVSLYTKKTDWKLSLKTQNSSALISFQDDLYALQLDKANLKILNTFFPFLQISSGNVSGKCLLTPKKELTFARLQVSDLDLFLTPAKLEKVKGSLSFDQKVGAKWELEGTGAFANHFFPFTLEGKTFLSEGWLSSSIVFDHSSCKISKDHTWKIEGKDLSFFELNFFKQGLCLFYPSLSAINLEKGTVSFRALFCDSHWDAEVEAKNLLLKKEDYILHLEEAIATLNEKGGKVFAKDQENKLVFAGLWEDWRADVEYLGAFFSLKGGKEEKRIPIQIEKGSFKEMEFSGKGWINFDLDAFFEVEGTYQLFGRKIPFSLPFLEKNKQSYTFDFRLCRNTWDLFRLKGKWDGQKMSYDPVSQALNQPLYFLPAKSHDLDFCVQLPSKAVQLALPFLKDLGIPFKEIPALEMLDVRFQYKEGLSDLFLKSSSPFFFFQAKQNKEGFDLQLDSDLTISAFLGWDGTLQGSSELKNTFQTEFKGKVDPSFHCNLSLQKSWINLDKLHFLPLEGEVRGSGHLIYTGSVEADFDFVASSLKVHSFPLENKGQIHLHYNSEEGAQLRGIHLHGGLDCVVDLLTFDPRSHWVFQNAKIHLPSYFLTHPFFEVLDQKRDLNFTADLDVASNFSSFSLFVKEGSLPYGGEDHLIENLHLVYQEGACFSSLWYQNHFFKFNMQTKEGVTGKVSVGEEAIPLTVDWTYQDKLYIHSIEGSFSGIEASFHEESPNTLLGSARVNFSALCPILPEEVARVFEEIHMGQGYELKGRLKIQNNKPYFQGILGGKGIELFGFQFKTLLGRVDLSPHQMRLHEIKISDGAGIMKIDEILIQDENPWTIQIPNLTILEMRPSLLQRPNQPVGSLTPLLVRNLKIQNFKGILDDGSTYTAEGNLHFINSYKRQETVFDLPANVLGRIVGIDLDLLIPVKGDLSFEIKDGYFFLKELSNAFSEGKRSQFFLEEDPPPRMSLDGDLQIFIKMKQFVLLKITESFLISIDGSLQDPQVRLKKKSFFGIF